METYRGIKLTLDFISRLDLFRYFDSPLSLDQCGSKMEPTHIIKGNFVRVTYTSISSGNMYKVSSLEIMTSYPVDKRCNSNPHMQVPSPCLCEFLPPRLCKFLISSFASLSRIGSQLLTWAIWGKKKALNLEEFHREFEVFSKKCPLIFYFFKNIFTFRQSWVKCVSKD